MTEPNNEQHNRVSDAIIRALEANLDSLEDEMRNVKDEILAQRRSLWGHPEVGQAGLLQEREKRIVRLEEDIGNTRKLCEGLREDRTIELAERRGSDATIKRFMSFTGVSSIVTFLTLLGLIIAILSSSGITGGP